MVTRAGVLALQGEVDAHLARLAEAGAEPRPVRRRRDLDGLTHLVLPGGESTTQALLLARFGLWDAVGGLWCAGELCLFGTCAGAILLGRGPGPPSRLGLLDAEVHRNAYGNQLASTSREVRVDPLGRALRVPFIRAPRFGALCPGVRVLARAGDEPVLVEGPRLLAATFHPELADDAELFAWWLARHGAATSAADVG